MEQGMILYIVLVCIVVGLLVFLAVIAKGVSDYEKQKQKANLQKQQNFLKINNAYMTEVAKHKEGLPATGYEDCIIFIRKDDVLIRTQNQQFSIPYIKIHGAIVSSQWENIVTEINSKNKPSITGAVVGGVLFGTAGAIIGANTGKTTLTTTNSKVISELYLAISYKSENDEEKAVIFSASPHTQLKKIENEINNRIMKKEQGTIVL